MDLKLNSIITLNNKTKMPRLGFGVYKIPPGQPTYEAVTWALKAGYRHIDTAKFYRNETSVGKAIRASGIAREKIWVTTKLWPTDFLNVEKAFETSLAKLKLDYVDLYLVHWPLPGTAKKVWRKMESLYLTGKVKAIGVSNYSAVTLQATLDFANIAPSVNQVRCSVFGYDKSVYELCQQNGVVFEAYSPLTHGKQLNNNSITEIADIYGKSNAQIMLRWALQKNIVVIPKSTHEDRIIANADIFDFEISPADIRKLDKLSAKKVSRLTFRTRNKKTI
ncbi:MAG TPA: aldo/keto reductase [Candidatus Saccharimonadales bacterium]|jgi:diketogulonate reductase-like aldo/keto reductase|nr:aldo/keto reductase [Candidatus Saccharimonadales bacterium]